MKWAVEVQRTALDRRNFEDLLAGLGFSLIDGVQYPALWSQEMDQCNTAAEAFELAKKVRSAFAGPAQVDPEFTLGSVVDYTSSPPSRHAFLEVQSCVSKATVGTVTISVGPPTGLSAAELEAWRKNRVEQEYQTKLETQRSRLEPAYLERRAAKVLEHLAIASPSAEVLYKIYELVEEHPSKRAAVQAQLGISVIDFKRFQDSVHNPAVSGDWARHAYHDTPRTTNPMSKSEAEGFARGIAERWLKHLRTSTPP
jgi:hypothetical protein